VHLLDNDSAHHANIAMHMYLTGNYVDLVDNGKDYLDKPHLLFWLSAASYHLFGITSFAYKFPTFLFTIGGTYCIYRLGKSLYNNEVGKLAALVAASAFAYLLANNDVRMDAILTACVAFATWQLVDWSNKKQLINAVGAGLGLALGFSTKGQIAVLTPAISIFFYLLYKKEWRLFYHWQLLIIVLSFFIFISPVLYCYYLQYDLHPEKVIRGRRGWSGVKFILWQQVFERYEGSKFGNPEKRDYLFFFHSFLWAFAPWSLLTYAALFHRLRSFIRRRSEWLTTATILVMALMITFSGFKLPHYINIIFPVAAVLTAAFLLEKAKSPKFLRQAFLLQIIVCCLCVALSIVINAWAFPLTNLWVAAGGAVLLLAAWRIVSYLKSRLQKLIALAALTSVLVFYLLNANFYPQLLTYQAGNELALSTQTTIDPKKVFYWPGLYSPSFSFYSREIKKEFSGTVMQNTDTVWILTDKWSYPQLEASGLRPIEQRVHHDYSISTLTLNFINPNKRKQTLDTLLLVRVK
jgi:4-amino-4-deoxy-L-arabinose transferase-like glycosyltransferase